ncbi:MAG: phosphopantetheine-binding protein [Desulfovibrio sp.]|jgi:acyl carrier protein|nr:phosphopantetheine-binding protein [Desulfovibrio sp.]
MTDQEIVQKAYTALAQEFELDISQMNPETRLREDLGLDSLDYVDMVVVLEQAFGVKIGKDPELTSVRTLGDVHEFILNKKRALEKIQ